MEYKNAPAKTIPNAGASKNTPKSDTDNIVPITNPIIQNIPINKLNITNLHKLNLVNLIYKFNYKINQYILISKKLNELCYFN